MSPKQKLVAISIAAVTVVAAIAISLVAQYNNGEKGIATFASNETESGSLTIITISGGFLVGGAAYQISPNPFTGSGNYTVQDGGSNDGNPTDGIITIAGPRDGTFVITQLEAPAGYARDRFLKIVEIKDHGSDAATFNNVAANETGQESNLQVRSIVYTSKFECGTIQGGEGPLRPGHYDTDIGVFNKQDFPVGITWNAVTNDGRSTNTILRTLQPQTSMGIVCKDLTKTFGNDRFLEGFVMIEIPLDSKLLGTLSGGGIAVVGRTSPDSIDLLDVQVFYTANALDELPHEVLVDKITFTIVNDTSGKVPQSMISKVLDISVPSSINEVSDPLLKVKQALAEKYNLTDQELAALDVEINSVSVGVGAMIDDHAISLFRPSPQANSSQ